MEFETIPTVPTADEVLDRSLRRAAAKKKLKINIDRANEEFVRAVASSIHDKLKSVVTSFPSFERLPPFYREVADILVSLDRLKRSLGAITWAADQVRVIGSGYARRMRSADDTGLLRRQAVARILERQAGCGRQPQARQRLALESAQAAADQRLCFIEPT